MTQALRRVSAKMATLHKRDVTWLLKQLPGHLSAELATYTKEFSHLIKREKNTFIGDINAQFIAGYQEAQTKKQRLDVLAGILASITDEEAEQLNLSLSGCICNELTDKYGWRWLAQKEGIPASQMSPYAREKVLQMMLNNRD